MTMNNNSNTYDVIITGGGPVGLYLACRLVQSGISCKILEKRSEPSEHSRSLGIHPVSLELFEKLDLADSFLHEGVKITKGMAFAGDKRLGTITFEHCPGPFRFILAQPQYRTETLLEKRLNELNPNTLMRNREVTGVVEDDDGVRVITNDQEEYKCTFLVGCDGKNSAVRELAGIKFRGSTYPDTYIMGDYTDNTIFDSAAAIFLCKEGLIESIPFGPGKRRWVVKTSEYLEEVTRKDMEKRVATRIGHDLGEEENYMLSSFGVQRMVADPIVKDRIILAGDAAHVVSPIGGQGMNLGWLGAEDLAGSLEQIIKNGSDYRGTLQGYARRRRRNADKTSRRAELNMKLGRKKRITFFRNLVVRLMMNPPLSRKMARFFTMRGVG